MSKLLTVLVIVVIFLTSACSKSGAGSGAPITDEGTAKTAFLAINSLWTATLKPALTKEAQTYANMSLNGVAGGKAIVNGSFIRTNFSSSTSASNTSLVDVTITFQQYETNGLRLDGVLRFFDSYSYRMSCGSASKTLAHWSVKVTNGSNKFFTFSY